MHSIILAHAFLQTLFFLPIGPLYEKCLIKIFHSYLYGVSDRLESFSKGVLTDNSQDGWFRFDGVQFWIDDITGNDFVPVRGSNWNGNVGLGDPAAQRRLFRVTLNRGHGGVINNPLNASWRVAVGCGTFISQFFVGFGLTCTFEFNWCGSNCKKVNKYDFVFHFRSKLILIWTMGYLYTVQYL